MTFAHRASAHIEPLVAGEIVTPECAITAVEEHIAIITHHKKYRCSNGIGTGKPGQCGAYACDRIKGSEEPQIIAGQSVIQL